MTEQRRDKIMIVLDILDVLSEKSLKGTHLLYKSNLSHPRLKFYLGELIAKDLVEEVNTKDGKRYRITPDGLTMREKYRHVRDFSKGFGV